ncbi:MAG: hypothetical protein EOP42_06085 [Sphingobacteriaceae bacterium]|nr:MAG: hypothetical protein EOP42_06085 [Sphingobacteriaceae bacterium]
MAALPVAVFSAQKNKAKCGFDAEDFHRNETSDDTSSTDYKLKTIVEDKLFLKIDYLTVASTMIGEVYQQLYENHATTIFNVFPRAANVLKSETTYSLKLVWFSQYIGFNRGLETIFAALEHLAELNIELHLVGFLSPEMKDFMQCKSPLSAVMSKITVHDPIPPDHLIEFISKFDIGLAIETGQPLNREICLTNKIFSYIQAGLAVLASDTKAQIQLLSAHPEVGKLYDKNSINNLIEALKAFYINPKHLLQCKLAALNLGQMHFNWETESQKFLKLIAETLA